MTPVKELADEIYRQRVQRARVTPIQEKLAAGAEWFEYECRVTCDGIRHQNPGIDESEVQRILGARLARGASGVHYAPGLEFRFRAN
jgi:hypothetical protein